METNDYLQSILSRLEQINADLQTRLDDVEAQLAELKGAKAPTTDRLTTSEASQCLGINRMTLGKYRDEHWIEGVHYFPQAKGYLYNRVLIEDWQQNRVNPVAHQRAIELWLSQQAGYQQKRRKAS